MNNISSKYKMFPDILQKYQQVSVINSNAGNF